MIPSGTNIYATLVINYTKERTIEKYMKEEMICRKKPRFSSAPLDLFDTLPDDLVISILCKLSSTASSPSDFINILSTCTRLNQLGLNRNVLNKAGINTVAVRAKNWSESAHRFLKKCIDAGNIEACYYLGMIRFYCMQNRGIGVSLMARAAIKNHVPSLYSLAIIQFNGSGGSKDQRNFRSGVALCARAASLGHIDSHRELGHCLYDGYGVRRNTKQGRVYLTRATALELASAIRASPESLTWRLQSKIKNIMTLKPDPNANPSFGPVYWNDLGLQMSPRGKHPVNQFLLDWFGSISAGEETELVLCSDQNCGRPETRVHEYRRCSGCWKVKYCSRGCQAHDWKVRHKMECSVMPQWEPVNAVLVDPYGS